MPENRLQELLATEPTLLPVDEFEAAFAPLILLGREVRCTSGYMDLLFCSPDGYLTLVEVKLWKNPQARREVVGQILDYAKDLAAWSFEDLDNAVRAASGNGVFDLVRRVQPDTREDRLADQIARNLRLGRVLLVVVGDGIREGVEHIADHLQRQPGLQFALALVELALYETDAGRLLVLPRTLARTVEVERVVFEMDGARLVRAEAHQTVAPAPSQSGSGRRSLTEAMFFEEFETNAGADVARGVRDVMDELERLGVRPTWGLASSVTMRFPDPSNQYSHTVVAFTMTGGFWIGYLDTPKRAGYSEEIAELYLAQVVAATGAQVGNTPGTIEMPAQVLLSNRDAFLTAASTYVGNLREAAGD